MRTKPVQFLDTSGEQPRVLFGVKVYVHGKWALVTQENPETGRQEPVLFDNERDQEAERKKLRQIRRGSDAT